MEWEASQKANAFEDHRIGEKVDSMSKEDKIFARFKRQQARSAAGKKASKYSLAEADEDGGDAHELTHGGRKLKEVNYEEDRLDGFSDEEDDGKMGTCCVCAPLAVPAGATK